MGWQLPRDGKTLILGSTGNGKLYNVNQFTGHATEINLGEAVLPFADGLLLDGQTLFVVQNWFGKISEVQLDPTMTSGSVTNVITHPEFNWPMSIVEYGHNAYVTNLRYSDAPPGAPPSGMEFT